MNLQQVTGPPIMLVCIRCFKLGMTSRNVFYADTEGKPFEDYYCEPCADALRAEEVG